MAGPGARSRSRELLEIFRRSFAADPDYRLAGRDLTPVEWLLSRSNVVDLTRQYLPERLGGYGEGRLEDFDRLRASDPEVLGRTVRAGDYPELPLGPTQEGFVDDALNRAAQFAGVAAKDFTTQGLQNIWWFLNAYEAASLLAGKQAQHGAMASRLLPWEKPIPGAPLGAPFSRNPLRFAASFPLVIGAASATGTLFRQPGYAAVLPSQEDKRESSDPLTESVMRAVGRTGALLPYDEFVKERPDVSREEYESYKSYLFGNKSMIKFNPDGIHGAEINFVGKSVPLLTGLLPVAGGVLGGRIGLRMAGQRVSDRGGFGTLKAAEKHATRRKKVWESAKYNGGTTADKYAQGRIISEGEAKMLYEDAVDNHVRHLDGVELDLLKGSMLGSSAGLGITGAAAMLLENVRRARNAEQNRQEAEQTPPASATAPVVR